MFFILCNLFCVRDLNRTQIVKMCSLLAKKRVFCLKLHQIDRFLPRVLPSILLLCKTDACFKCGANSRKIFITSVPFNEGSGQLSVVVYITTRRATYQSSLETLAVGTLSGLPPSGEWIKNAICRVTQLR